MAICEFVSAKNHMKLIAKYELYSECEGSEPISDGKLRVILNDVVIEEDKSLILPDAQMYARIFPASAMLRVLSSAIGWSLAKNRPICSFWLSDFGAFVFYKQNSQLYTDLFYYSINELGVSAHGLGKIGVIVSHMLHGLYILNEDCIMVICEHGSYLFRPGVYMRASVFNELVTSQDVEMVT